MKNLRYIGPFFRMNSLSEKEINGQLFYLSKEAVKTIKPHRILALNRGEKEEILSIKIDFDNDAIINYLNDKIIKNNNSECALIILSKISKPSFCKSPRNIC